MGGRCERAPGFVGAYSMKLGLLGASQIATRVLPLIRDLPGLDVIAVAASERARAEEFASRSGLRAHASYTALLNDPSIDAVYISVLNSDHARLVEAALDAGKNVLCEKPLVLTEHDAARLFTLAAQKERLLMEGLMYRFHPQMGAIRRGIQTGQIGEPLSIRAEFSFMLETHGRARRTLRGGGGAVEDLGCYLIDFANQTAQLAGDPSVPLVTVRQVRLEGEICSAVSFDLNYAGGLRAELSCAIDRASLNPWEVQGERGAFCVLRNQPQGAGPVTLTYINEDSESSVMEVAAAYNGLSQFALEFANFRDAVLGRGLPAITASDSIRNAAVMDRVRAACRVGA